MTQVKLQSKDKPEQRKHADISSAKIARCLDGVAVKTIELGAKIMTLMAPAPRLNISDWADENIMLPETSPEPGNWHTSRTPYIEEPMNACGDLATRRVVLVFGAQLGKTALLLNVAGYYIDKDPCPIMIVRPTQDDAEEFSKERFTPMVRLSECLSSKVFAEKSRDSNNTLRHKGFPGGFVKFVGANTPRELASWPIRIVEIDEYDRMMGSVGREGDVLGIVEKRQTNFQYNSKLIINSTPTIAGESRVWEEYETSTMEQWCVPCPSCGEFQPYEWDRIKFDIIQKDGEEVSADKPEITEPVMACRSCGCMHEEYEWKSGKGRWIARKKNLTTRGFQLSALASPWLTWKKFAEDFLDAKAKGAETLKTFVNTRFAECWEEKGDTLNKNVLSDRQHAYGCDVPEGVNFITAGVDVQKDRLEYEIVGWGAGSESWGIEYGILFGDPHHTTVWNELDAIMQESWQRADGVILPMNCVAVDSGYAATTVYEFTRKRNARYVFAIKGIGGPGKARVSKNTWQGKNKKCPMWPVGTDATKDLVYTRLCTDEEGPDYCHFPSEETNSKGRKRGYDEAYFKGLLTEKRVQVKTRGGMHHMWKKMNSHDRNEPFDCRGYASAALEIRNPDLNKAARGAVKPAVGVGGARPGRGRGRRVLSKGIEV